MRARARPWPMSAPRAIRVSAAVTGRGYGHGADAGDAAAAEHPDGWWRVSDECGRWHPLSGLTSLLSQGRQPATGGPFAGAQASVGGQASSAAGDPLLPMSAVDGMVFPRGREATAPYIAKALDVMGITDPVARANLDAGTGQRGRLRGVWV